MHILKALKSSGKATVILPHGVLFRGNAEATIREAIIKKHWNKGIISLPANLFYGTGIAACVLVIDKEGAANRQGNITIICIPYIETLLQTEVQLQFRQWVSENKFYGIMASRG